jgi:hypothetical protein
MVTASLNEQIRKLDLQPNSVLFINMEEVSIADVAGLHLPFVDYTVPIVFTMGPPLVALLTRAELEQALHALDNDQTQGGEQDGRAR